MTDQEQQEILEQAWDRAIAEQEALPWYQKNPDLSVPLFIIAVGLFQFVLRKWLLPVRKEIYGELEDSFPGQGLYYQPVLGIFLMVVGFVLLVLFNIESILSF